MKAPRRRWARATFAGAVMAAVLAATPSAALGGVADPQAAAGPPPQAAVVVALDVSASIAGLEAPALARTLDRLGARADVGIVLIGDAARVARAPGPLTTAAQRASLRETLSRVRFEDRSTDLVSGLDAALDAVRSDEARSRFVVLVSDCRDDPPDASAGPERSRVLASLLARYADLGVRIHSVAYGDADGASARRLAEETGGSVLRAPDAAAVLDAFAVVSDLVALHAVPPPAEAAPAARETTPPAGEPAAETAPATEAASPAAGSEPGEGDAGSAPSAGDGRGIRRLLDPLGPAMAGLVLGLLASAGIRRLARRKPGPAGPPQGEAGDPPREEPGPAGAGQSLPGIREGLHALAEDVAGQVAELERRISLFGVSALQAERGARDKYLGLVDGLFLLVDHYDDYMGRVEGEQLEALSWFRQRALRVLDDEGIHPMEVRPGEAFDSSRHKVIEKKADVSAAGTILAVTRVGFVVQAPGSPGEDVLRPAEVVVSGGPSPEGRSEEHTGHGA